LLNQEQPLREVAALSFALQMAMVPRVALEVSPAQVAFSEMLALPCAAMEAAVDRELSTNPALERLETGECPICRGKWTARCPACGPPRRARSSHLAGDVGDRGAAEPDTQSLLRAVRLEIAADEAPIAEYLIDSLDEHGRLDRSCAQVADELGVPDRAVEGVLGVIRAVGPPGVGATSVSECLLLQLDALGADDDAAWLARRIIADHLPALARGRFASIARALGVSRTDVEQALALIRARLRPYPAFDGNAPAAGSYVVPDVVVREHGEIDGAFTVELVEPALMRLGVRSDARPSADASVAQAKAFCAQLHDRWDSLRRVAEYAVQYQHDFLAEGPAALKPLTRAEVAAELGLHESTVSRAVAEKYVLMPDGRTVPLARFFGVRGGVDGELRKLLASADGPMSDTRLAARLCDAGYPIARRTVAKHRARLGFSAAPLR
jgi:RNA polymerase sigma-54 factor